MLSLGCYYHRHVQVIAIDTRQYVLYYIEKGSNFIAYRFEFFKRVIQSENREKVDKRKLNFR